MFKLNQKVTIKPNGRRGKIVGHWQGINQSDKFNVQYVDASDRVLEDWFFADDLEPAE